MDPIVTITFHPCIDVHVTVPALVPEIKMSCSAPLLQPGGGGINVARAVRKLGGNATAIYMAGGENGEKLTGMLEEEGIRSIVLEAAGNTRENLIIKDEASGGQYRFNLPGPAVRLSTLMELLALLRGEEGIQFLVVSGSVAPGMSLEIFDKLAAIAERKKIKMIIDTSGEALRATLRRGTYLLKLSVHELISLSEPGEREKTVEELALQLIARGSCSVIVVSMGADGALLVTRDAVRHIPAPVVKVIGTVGAGDSLLAGIVLSLQRGKNLEEAVAYGCLCGSAATTRPGTSLCTLQDVESLQTIDACP